MRRLILACSLPLIPLLGAANGPQRAPDVVPVAIEIVAMPAEMDVIRQDPAIRDWPVTCHGMSGEEQVLRFALPAGTDRAALSRIFGDTQHPHGAARRYWFAGDRIPARCNVALLNLVLKPKRGQGGTQVDPQLLTAGPRETIAPMADIARKCGFANAAARSFRDGDVAPHPADWRADWATLDAGEKIAPRTGPVGCFRRLSANGARVAPAIPPGIPPTIATTAAWSFDQEPSMCILQRGYGEGSDRINLALREHVGLRRLDVVLGRPKISGEPDNWSGGGKIVLLPSGQTFGGEAVGIDIGGGRQAIRVAADSALLDLLETSNALVVDTGRGPMASLAIDHIAVPRDTLRACQDDVMRGWGIDPQRFRRLTLPGEPDPDNIARYFTAGAYPLDARMSRKTGRVTALIEIAADGHVAKCNVIETSHSASLDKATCDIARTRFHLSTWADAAGRAVTSWRMFAVRWVSP
ncbi:TonB family protein [Sphingomonas sp. AR_OL41]|nr:TonB family protein [Sphingomonas sp. AR_OL41]